MLNILLADIADRTAADTNKALTGSNTLESGHPGIMEGYDVIPASEMAPGS